MLFMTFLKRVAVVAVLLAPGAGLAQDVDGRGALIDDLCAEFPAIYTYVRDFANDYASGSDDLDGDGLPDEASVALVNAVACDGNAPLALAAATSLAYDTNLLMFGTQLDIYGIPAYRGLAVLVLTSATTETAVKSALALAEPPLVFDLDFVQVTCSGDTCTPLPAANTSTTGEILEFVTGIRATNEPFSAAGDLDGDGTDNLTEWNNIQAQGGTLGDFVVAATSAELNGTEPVRSSGSGCFIATAAYGTPLAGQIDVLRRWRDGALLTNAMGSAFSDVYYRLSPPIAERVAASPTFAGWTRLVIGQVIALMNAWVWVGAALCAGAIATLTWRSRRPRRARVR